MHFMAIPEKPFATQKADPTTASQTSQFMLAQNGWSGCAFCALFCQGSSAGGASSLHSQEWLCHSAWSGGTWLQGLSATIGGFEQARFRVDESRKVSALVAGAGRLAG